MCSESAQRPSCFSSRATLKRSFLLLLVFALLVGCTVQADLGGGNGAQSAALTFPLEVLGSGAPDDPVIVHTSLRIAPSDLAAVQTLYVQCHRCGFYGPPEFEALSKPLTTVKASLRIDGDASVAHDAVPWIDITDSNVTVDPVSAAHGGVNGALVTIGFRVAIDDATRARLVAAPGTNEIEFRFNGTDGISNGFRVLDVQFQDGAGNDSSPATKTWADISVEKAAGQAASSASAQGATLWNARSILIKSPVVPRTIRAACSDCHAADGRDLQYFNYSNNAIVQRSRFYGLSEAQGQDIAAYLRASLYAKVPHVAAAAPWNPPYQPGTGLDGAPALEWAAGAGLTAVLPDGKAFVQAFTGHAVDDLPLSVTQADITGALDPAKLLNTREMQLPLQFPDWNAWLPIIHPLDIWTPASGQSSGLFEIGYRGSAPLTAYMAIESWLDTNQNPSGVYADWTNLTPDQRNEIQSLLPSLGDQTLSFGGGGLGSRVSTDPNNPYGGQLGAKTLQALASSQTIALADLSGCGAMPCTPFTAEAFIERVNLGLYHWMGVKQWEIVESYGLQDQASFHGSVDSSGTWVGQGEARGWPYSWPSIFYLAPRLLYVPTSGTARASYFSWENGLTSYYRTNQWDQLQVSLNPGWAGASNGPIDWPNNMGFIQGLADDLIAANADGSIAATHLARFFLTSSKLSQLSNTDISFNTPDPSDPNNLDLNSGLQSKADLLYKLAPSILLDQSVSQPSRFRYLDQIGPGTYLEFVNGFVSSYDALFTGTSRSSYRICDPSNMQWGEPEQYAGTRFCIDAARTPLPLDAQGQPYCPYPADDGYTTEQYSVWGVMAARQLGVDPTLVQRWSNWNDLLWPN
jgi:hypothetical protein